MFRRDKLSATLIKHILMCIIFLAALSCQAESKANLTELSKSCDSRESKEPKRSTTLNLIDDVFRDHTYHYSATGLTTASLFIGAGGVLANSGLDRSIQRQWQGNMRYKVTDEFTALFKKVGTLKEFNVTMPFYVGAIVASQFSDNEQSNIFKLGNWGSRTFRTILLGAPQQALLTSLLGGKRPRYSQAKWRLLTGNRSVSGHAFYGAAPFINASHLAENTIIKVSWLIASALPAISRVNDDKHYFSQSLLGWGLAYVAASSVNKTQLFNKNPNLIISTVPIKDGGFLGIKLKF